MLVIVLLLSVLIIYSARTIAGTLLSTVVFYTVLRPLFLYLVHRWNWKRWISALSVMLLSLVTIVVPFLMLAIMVIRKVSEFQSNSKEIKQFFERITSFASEHLHQKDLLDKVSSRAEVLLGELFPSVIGGLLDLILGLVILYFLLYFMLVQQEDFERGVLNYAPIGPQNSLKFANELKNVTYSNVLGQGLIAIVQGSLVGLGFWIFGIPDAFFWGTISIFVSFLPTIGASIVLVPAALIELANGDKLAGWGLLLWGLVIIMNIDNVIRMIINKHLADTHPVITIVGMIIGIPMFGIMGMVFGPLLLSYFILAIKIYETNIEASRRLEQIRSLGPKPPPSIEH